MDLTEGKLGLPSDRLIQVVNLKYDPMMIGSLLTEPGFFPAYHMNKEHWITVALDHSAPDDTLKMLVDISFDATAPRRKKKLPRSDC